MKILAKAERPDNCEMLIMCQKDDGYYVQYQREDTQVSKRFDSVMAGMIFMRFCSFFAYGTVVTDRILKRWLGEG